MGKVMLEVRNLKTKYVTRFHEDVYAVDSVSFKIEEGKSLGIAGESGCGKSTLALSMMGYYFPPLHYMSGDIVIDGRNISGMKPDDVRKSILGTEIAYIPQAAMNALNPTQRIIRFIEDVVRAHDPKKDKKLIRELAEARFAELGLPPEVLDKHAVELSGGMKQRTVIAVSTILNPKVLIADEPSSALDVTSQKMVIKMMRELMEKGYADLELSVHSIGGHSSRPFGGTSLGRLSGAIADITRAPFAVHLNSAMTGAFETLAPYITEEPLKTLTQDVAGNADAIAACCMGSPDLFPFVTTTIAPTMIHGGSAACNVMPQDMTAVINFRLADGDTVKSVMAHCREAVQDKGVEMRFLQANDPSAIARRDGYGYRKVVESMQRYFPDVVFIPSMTAGATDAHRYEEICDTCLRCSPFMAEPTEAVSGVHGTNERILVRSYLQGIRVLIDLMEHANVDAQ